ncbi:MAG: ScnB-like protein [Pseudomonadota bacterium]
MAHDTSEVGRSWHDMGGQSAGEVDQSEHDYALWEKRVDALRVLASEKGYFTVDGLRRSLEDMGEEAFETMSYYDRWMASTCQNLIAEGAFSIEELNKKMAEVKARGATYGEAQGAGE